TGASGLRGGAGTPGGDAGDDVAMVASTRAASCAAVFTRSRFAGPSVALSRQRAAAGRARGVVVVATNANVATGPRGEADAAEVSGLAARAAGVPAEHMLIASTGVIGRPYPMPLLRAHFAGVGTAGWEARPLDVARAMMTTDTVPKTAEHPAGPARVVGVAKGVGMVQPDMATMLAFAFTDAEVEPGELARSWRRAVDDTFNCLSIDTDTSTSDTAAVFASGAAGPVPAASLAAALYHVCLDLTLQLARDGEGATKLLTVTVRSARDRDQARRVAKAIVNSPLVKTAVHGADPNWGRVAMAVGKCSEDTDIDPRRVEIAFGDVVCYPVGDGPDLQRLRAVMAGDHVEIEVGLGAGRAEATVYGCDLTAGYVRINADYTT
ncbi:MAG TPA: bifunctional glutamate N-acetyltransferase/amino-acid acetyltransferase ArgJ, partial [Acidimicrobiales bacterium]|nr:bifunctional glutamate N-acetyltransferase/amino-acid acetyltransferase ArgJ [Acidimicrobiales bacterium]